MARHASNKQNGRGKYQHTGLLVSFCLTSHRHVLDRAQPPTLQQGGSPIFIVLEGWTLAAIFRSGSIYWYYDWATHEEYGQPNQSGQLDVLGLPEECGLQ